MKKVELSLEDALELWLINRSDDFLRLLISGAATKPQVKVLLDDRLGTACRRKNLPIRKKAFHGNYKEMLGMRDPKDITDKIYTLKKQ